MLERMGMALMVVAWIVGGSIAVADESAVPAASKRIEKSIPAPESTVDAAVVENTVVVRNTSGAVQVDRPVSVARPFRQGELPGFVQASLGGTNLVTQTDVKNRWPDGSLKFAIVSFVIPRLEAGASVTVTFGPGASGNNDDYLQQADMLAAGFDFDAEIALSGAVTRTIRARDLLSAGQFRYWLRGPVVTAVILEDRTPARSRDTDMGDDSKSLHPIFEAWFYPGLGKVQVGYTLENIWVSNTLTRSMRDQQYALTLRSGHDTRVDEFSHPSMNHIGKTRWHRVHWTTATDPPAIHIDHNIDYIKGTRAIPNYDTSFQIAESLISDHYNSWLSAPRSIDGNTEAVGNYDRTLGSGGAAPHIGLMPTWDTLYLLTMDDRMLEKSLGNADLAGRIQYFMREADTGAGTGGFFDDQGTVDTFGRPISVNARETVTLNDLSLVCYGYDGDIPQIGTVTDEWGFYHLGRHHMPDTGYVPYLITGRYYYLEQLQLQAAYIIGWVRGCYGSSWLRQGSNGYLHEAEIRSVAWGYRTVAYSAFLSPDGTPEKDYFESKLLINIAKDAGEVGVPNPIPALQSKWEWGRDNRMHPKGPSPLGLRDAGNDRMVGNPVKQDGSVAAATSPWMEHFGLAALGVARDFGYPTDDILRFQAKHVFGQLLNPATTPYLIEGYRTASILTATDDWIRRWEDVDQYHNPPTAWAIGTSVDHGYGFIALAATSFLYGYTVDGHTGQEAWEFLQGEYPGQDRFATESPKWAILPRTSVDVDPPPPPPPTDPPPAPEQLRVQ